MKFFPFLALSLLAAGCLDDAELEVETSAQELIALNGVNLNGVNLNGVNLNGVNLNGVNLNGVNLNGVNLNGVNLNGVTLSGSQLTVNNASIVVGTTFQGALANGTLLPLRVDGITRGVGSNSDVVMYRITYTTSTGQRELCGTNASPTLALAVPGTWNYAQGVAGGGAYTASTTKFTFGCRLTAIAKCVEMGYKPWRGYTTHLASCTRALRGEFCGDGQPYTVDGTTINIYDAVNVQADTEAWDVEGEWSPAGAACISSKKVTRFYQATAVRPTCLETLKLKTCPGLGSVAKIRTELPPVN